MVEADYINICEHLIENRNYSEHTELFLVEIMPS